MKNKSTLSFFVMFLTVITVFSQNKKNVLLTINDTPVYASEFESVFNKNLDLVIDDSQKSVDGYLDLFIDYKLKIAEAYAEGLNKNEAYIKELTKYQDQLSENYLYDKKVTLVLTKEAYNRGLEEINANHVLIKVSANAKPEDSLVAYNKIKVIRKKAVNGEDFETLVKKYSEEPNTKETGGNLGYFSAFSMVYPFETAAYNTQVGSISEIVRTQFGYHIIKVNDRREKLPKISVSHIMIFDTEKKKNEHAEERINELYAMIQQGESFESIAKQFSEDKATGIKGGVIKPFESGNLRAPIFEAAAYKLTKNGEISKPIKSSFGWHIIQLNEIFPVKTFEESEVELKKRIKSGARAIIVTQAVNEKIKNKYGYKEGVSYMPFFNTYITDSIFVKKWKYTPIAAKNDKVLFTIGNKEVSYTDFAKYVESSQKSRKTYKKKETALTDYYTAFSNETIKNYFKQELEEENKEYAATLDEYRNGLLIFDVMQKNIWDAAKSDSTGLKAYYNATKNKYTWKKRVDVDILSATNAATAKQAQELLKKGLEIDKIKTQLNTKDKVNVIIISGIYEIDQSELPENLEIKEGVSTIYKREESSVVVNVKRIMAPTNKEFDEVKGAVLSNYQTVVEKNWMNKLHNKYNVVVNKKVLKKIKKKLDN